MMLKKRQVRRILVFLTLLSAVFYRDLWAATIEEAEAAEICQVIIHKRITENGQTIANTGEQKTEAELAGTTPQNGAPIYVFDISQYLRQVRQQDQHKTLAEIQREISDEVLQKVNDQQQLAQYGKLLDGCPRITAEGEFGPGTALIELEPEPEFGKDQAYLIISNLNESKTIQPIVLLPFADPQSQPLHVYTKETKFVQQPYFYKHGQAADGTDLGPLAQAVFRVYKVVNDEKYYLLKDHLNGSNLWHKDESAAIATFTSDETGRVSAATYELPAGAYIFEEMEAPAGYERTPAAENVQVTIPKQVEQGVQITIDGQTTPPAQAKVYNMEKSRKQTDPVKPIAKEKYPLTGEQMSLALGFCGIVLIGIVLELKKYFH